MCDLVFDHKGLEQSREKDIHGIWQISLMTYCKIVNGGRLKPQYEKSVSGFFSNK